MLEHITLGSGTFLVLMMILSLVRLVFGPTILDQILAGNVIGTKTTALLLLIGILYEDLGMFVDISIAYALLNFIATLGASKYFIRRKDEYFEEMGGGES